jgi:hypothetical protein
MTEGHRVGDHLVLCAFSGFKVWRSDCVKTWDGRLVHRRFVGKETQRHPQEAVYVSREATPRNVQPEPTETYISQATKDADGIPILDGDGNNVMA